MLRNYLLVAFRNLKKNRASSIINIGGLAVGMAVALLIALWIYDEFSYNKYHSSYNRVARVMQHQTSNGIVYSGQAIPFPLGKELQTVYGSNFKYVAMASWQGSHILTYNDKKLSREGIYMDKDGPKMLVLDMVKGTIDGLKELNSIVISASTADALFGDRDPIGTVIRIDNKQDVKVTGVYADLPFNTSFRDLMFIAPWELYVAAEPWAQNARDNNEWDNNSFQLFAQIADNTDFKSVDSKIINAKLQHVPPEERKFDARVFLHPMSDWHLRSKWDESGRQAGGLIEYVWLFSLVGAFVLLLACINFMNLSTARSEKRAREVGIRKTVGSMRSQLIGQFYSESLLVVLFAFILSIVLVQLALPWFNSVAAKKMSIPWSNPVFWIGGLAFATITGVIAGSYPALYLSSFRPVKVLKGTFRVGRYASLPRKILVVLQFTISMVLIIGTMIVYRQVQYSKDRPIGYNRDGLMMVEMRSPDFFGKSDLLRNELKSSGAILELAESSSPLTDVWSNNGGFSWEGKDPNLDPDFATIWVTHDFGKAVGWQFKDGRDLSRDFPTDSSAVVVNESAVRFMNVKNPVGMTLKWGNRNFTVIGVIRDMLMQSPYRPVKQTIYFLNTNHSSWIILKLNSARSVHESVAAIEAAFRKIIPSAPFDFKFTDDEFAAKFAAEERVGKLATFFAALAIFISCLGLFGLASFVAEQRTKEIGVRKVLGASEVTLWTLLSKDFLMLVLIACLIATPLGWYFMQQWLMKYQYRTSISGWIFLAAGSGGLLITLFTVSYQAIRAAIANPVKSLRNE